MAKVVKGKEVTVESKSVQRRKKIQMERTAERSAVRTAQVSSKERVRFSHPFIHLKDPLDGEGLGLPLLVGRCTVAWVPTAFDRKGRPTEANLGFSFCSPHDQFRKAKGRRDAAVRMVEVPLKVHALRGKTMEQTIETLLYVIPALDVDGAPHRWMVAHVGHWMPF